VGAWRSQRAQRETLQGAVPLQNLRACAAGQIQRRPPSAAQTVGFTYIRIEDSSMSGPSSLLAALVPKTVRRRIRKYRKAYGPVTGLFAYAKLGCTRTGVTRVKVPRSNASILLRAGTSDIPTFEEVFLDNDYDFSTDNSEPRFIVDAGANIGCASVYFANRFPNAKIVAIEPESSNMALLRRNIAAYPNISAVQAGLWNKETYLEVVDPSADKWAFQLRECDEKPTSLKAHTVDSIMKAAGVDHVDVLKIDIEGSERELFSENCDWLKRVSVLIIELHDRLKPGCSATFDAAVANLNFSRFTVGMNTLLIRETPQ
jgi:FkbM family methyltransferase